MSQKKILVTGGCGFIGSNLSEHLVMDGEEVIVIDNLATGREENIEHFRCQDNFEFVKGSVTDIELLNSVLGDVEYVLHQAASTKDEFNFRLQCPFRQDSKKTIKEFE